MHPSLSSSVCDDVVIRKKEGIAVHTSWLNNQQTRWTFQKLEQENSWIIATEENRHIAVCNSTLSTLFTVSDLLRRAKGRICNNGLFSLTEGEALEWLRDCYGIGAVAQKAPILTHEVLERLLCFASRPSMFTDWLRTRHEIIRIQRASGCISRSEQQRVMSTLNDLRSKLIDASSGASQQEALRSIRSHIFRIAQTAVNSADPRLSPLAPMLDSLRHRTEASSSSLYAAEADSSGEVDADEHALLQDLCFLAKLRKALVERFESNHQTSTPARLQQMAEEAERIQSLCLRAGFHRDAIAALVNVGRALGIPALLRQCNAYFLWERECKRDTPAMRTNNRSRTELGAAEGRQGRSLLARSFCQHPEASTLPDVDECLGLQNEEQHGGEGGDGGDAGIQGYQIESQETGMELLMGVLSTYTVPVPAGEKHPAEHAQHGQATISPASMVLRDSDGGGSISWTGEAFSGNRSELPSLSLDDPDSVFDCHTSEHDQGSQEMLQVTQEVHSMKPNRIKQNLDAAAGKADHNSVTTSQSWTQVVRAAETQDSLGTDIPSNAAASPAPTPTPSHQLPLPHPSPSFPAPLSIPIPAPHAQTPCASTSHTTPPAVADANSAAPDSTRTQPGITAASASRAAPSRPRSRIPQPSSRRSVDDFAEHHQGEAASEEFKGEDRKRIRGGRRAPVLTEDEQELLNQQRRSEERRQRGQGKERGQDGPSRLRALKAAEERRKEQDRERREEEEARRRREQKLRELSLTTKHAVLRSLDAKRRKEREQAQGQHNQLEPHLQPSGQRSPDGAQQRRQTEAQRWLSMRRASARVADERKRRAQQEQEAQAAKEEARWRKRDERLAKFKHKMQLQQRLAAPLQPSQHNKQPKPPSSSDRTDPFASYHSFLRTLTDKAAAFGQQVHEKENRSRHVVVRATPTIHRICEEDESASSDQSTSSEATIDSVHLRVADAGGVHDDRIAAGAADAREAEGCAGRRAQTALALRGGREGGREGGKGSPLLLKWEDQLEEGRSRGLAREAAAPPTPSGSDSDDSDECGSTMDARDGAGAGADEATGVCVEREKSSSGRRELVLPRRPSRNKLGGWLMGGRASAAAERELGATQEGLGARQLRLGPPVLTAAESGLSVTGDGWIVRAEGRGGVAAS